MTTYEEIAGGWLGLDTDVCATLICLGLSIPYSTRCFPGWTIQASSSNRWCVLWPLKQGKIFSTAARRMSERTTRPLRKRPPARRTWTRICETNLTFINPRWQVRQGETSKLFSIQALRNAKGAIDWVNWMGRIWLHCRGTSTDAVPGLDRDHHLGRILPPHGLQP